MLEPGTQISRYEIHRRLGRGGMGSVYVAHDPVLGRMVAIKVFTGELDFPDARERFSREARSAAALNHRNIVTVYDFGEFDSQPFIVMEYVPGETLAALIRRKAPVSIADKLRWIEELCDGAGYAHQMSVIHRDIKPANLMIDRAGRLKILDFGIARVMGTASNTVAMIGTPGYMAPEQIEGKTVDHRADLFSIGVVSYELLAYTEAFPGDTVPTITHRILSEDPVPLTRLVADVDPNLVTVIERALQKNVAERFEDAESMRVAIGRIRRQFESDATWIRPADPSRRDTPPAPSGRGTGSARRPTSDAVAVASWTPSPDPKRTDREALARRRQAYLEAALESARALYEQDQLSAALEACQQALAYDETHTAALELEARIQSALLMRERLEEAERPASFEDAPAVAPDAGVLDGAAAAAGASPSQVAAAGAVVVGAAVDRTVLRVPVPKIPLPPSEPTIVRSSEAKAMPPSEPTIIAPSRRAPTTPPAPPAALRRTPKSPKQRVDFRAKLRALSATLPAIDLEALGRRPTLIWGGAGILAVAALGAGVMMVVGRPAPTGVLILDAVPWATVSAVASEDGEPQPLPSPASTPLALGLPAGTYQVVFVGPPPESREERVSVRVDGETATSAPLVRFRMMTPEEYFEPYLASPAPSAGDAPSRDGTAQTPGPSAPASAPPPAAGVTR